MSWTAVVPLKHGVERKARLADRLSAEARFALSETMAAHVLRCLEAVEAIGRIILLAPAPQEPFDWRPDEGRGLNAELEALRAAEPAAALLIVHGDLPLLAPADVVAVLEAAAASGAAMAPDRHGDGTNALALAPGRAFTFRFGLGSRWLHERQGLVTLVERTGLAIDVDTALDLDAAISAGLDLPKHVLDQFDDDTPNL